MTRGVEEIGDNVDALADSAKQDAADAKAAKAASAIVGNIAADVKGMEQKDIAVAKELAEKVQDMMGEAKTQQSSANAISAMVAKDKQAAQSLAKQAEQDLAVANKMANEASGGGAASIKAMVSHQVDAAKSAKSRAEAEIDSANKMEDQAQSLEDKANETSAAAAKLNQTAAAEQAKAEDVLEAAKKLDGKAGMLANTSDSIAGELHSTQAAEQRLHAEESNWEGKVEDALNAKAAAKLKVTLGEKAEAKAESSLKSAGSTQTMAEKEAAAAKAIEKELKAELQKMDNLTVQAADTKDRKQLDSLISKQKATVKKALSEAEDEMDHAASLKEKANKTAENEKGAIAEAKENEKDATSEIKTDSNLVDSTKSDKFWMKYANRTAGVLDTMTSQDSTIAKAMVGAQADVKGLLSKLEAQAGSEQKSSDELTEAATEVKKIADGSSGSVKTLQEQAAQEAKDADEKSDYVKTAGEKTQALGELAKQLGAAAKGEHVDASKVHKVLDEKLAVVQAAREKYQNAKKAAVDKQVQEILAQGKGCCSYPNAPNVCGPKDPNGFCDTGADACTKCAGLAYILRPDWKLAPVHVDVPNPDA
uniref:Uncharacterized protein n=1 Tax=Strombidinopsis acuminata TaxID=141414 RepID=A0A7S3X153_9SPIT